MKQPGKYKMAGEPFGPEDLYGIGLPLDSDGVAFEMCIRDSSSTR